MFDSSHYPNLEFLYMLGWVLVFLLTHHTSRTNLIKYGLARVGGIRPYTTCYKLYYINLKSENPPKTFQISSSHEPFKLATSMADPSQPPRFTTDQTTTDLQHIAPPLPGTTTSLHLCGISFFVNPPMSFKSAIYKRLCAEQRLQMKLSLDADNSYFILTSPLQWWFLTL